MPIIHDPLPCRAPKGAILGAAEAYAKRIGFVPGNSIAEVVELLGGLIVYRDFHSPASGSESIHVRAQDDFEIFVPRDTATVRDRFTIGHELGHLLLHYPVVVRANPGEQRIEMRALRYLPPNASEELKRCEWEANWFAAAFLMPSADVTAHWQSRHDLAMLARHFQVSTAAAENRLKTLSLVG